MIEGTLDPRFSGLDGAGTCPEEEKEKVWITQMYLCNANKKKITVLNDMYIAFTLFTG